MRRSLSNQNDHAELVVRLRRMAPESPRHWGRMTPHQAMCHLSDSFRVIMGSHPPGQVKMVLGTSLIKWIALYLPLRWPPGAKTLPEADQEVRGTKPVDFEQDRRDLEALMERFAQSKSRDLQPHPIFGRLSDAQWQRWGYLHVDHHLRQFGA